MTGRNRRRTSRKGAVNALVAAVAVAFTVFIVLNPEPAFQAAVRGLRVWWDIVFPALLPFFVGSEILMGLGVVHFMGVLLEPLMRPLFNVPGAGSFVMAMGLASGYPIGAMLTARLREKGLCSPTEGERLMCFTNTADPLFVTGAVAVGMFGRADIALTILAAHYLSSLSVGLVMRFYRPSGEVTPPIAVSEKASLGGRAWQALHEARERDGRPFGKLLGDAIRGSVNTLLLIGGFIILFAVLIEVLRAVGVVQVVASVIGAAVRLVGVDPAVAEALTSGIFEITLGTEAASRAAAGILPRVIAASAIIAWSGLSVHAQVASLIHGTGMSIAPYTMARVLHACLAGLYAFLLWGPMLGREAAVPVFLQLSPAQGGIAVWRTRLAICAATTGFLLATLAVLFGFVVVLCGVTFVFIDLGPGQARGKGPGR